MKNSKRALGLKALSFILVAALFFSISVPAFADYEPQFYVDFIGDDAVAITGVDLDTSVDSTLFIPAEIDGHKVVEIGRRAFADYDGLEAVEIPESVTKIGEEAFAGCINLHTIAIRGQIEECGVGAFNDTAWYKNFDIDFVIINVNSQNAMLIGYKGNDKDVKVPITIAKIGNGAFMDNDSVETVILPERTKSIGAYAFANCSNLSEITALGDINIIGENAFQGTKWFEEYPGDYIGIGKVFIKYKGSEEVAVIPNTYSVVSDGAFEGCKKTFAVKVPASVDTIGETAFFTFSDQINNHFAEIYAYAGTHALEYAQANGLAYTVLNRPGDLDGDGKITAADARLVLRIVAKLDKKTNENTLTADVTGDDTVKADDARMMLRIAAKLDKVTAEDLLSKPSSKVEILNAYADAVKFAVNNGAGYTKKAYQEFKNIKLNTLTQISLMFMENKSNITKPKNAKNQVYDVDSDSALTGIHLPTLVSTKNIQSATCTINDKGQYVITIVMGKETAQNGVVTDTQKLLPAVTRSTFDNLLKDRLWYKAPTTKFNYTLYYNQSKVVAVVDIETGFLDSITMTVNHDFEISGQIYLTKITDGNKGSVGKATRVDTCEFTAFKYS